MKGEGMILRNADSGDRTFFYDLRNDADSVRFSYTKQPVGWAEHTAWWYSNHDHCFVAMDHETPIGYVRLTPMDETTCEIHFALAPKQRGKGLASFLLSAAKEKAHNLGYKHIVAKVDAPNTPSIRAFLREGYQITSAGTLFLERDV